MVFVKRLKRTIRPEQRMANRRVLYIPQLKERVSNRRDASLEKFERMSADGAAFIPEAKLPPWKRRLQYKRPTDPTFNFSGFRARALPTTDHPGFPTHFQ
jgi:hypothetical protein